MRRACKRTTRGAGNNGHWAGDDRHPALRGETGGCGLLRSPLWSDRRGCVCGGGGGEIKGEYFLKKRHPK